MSKHLFTSESVGMGHPDKMADQISDAVLDAIIREDPAARVAVETLLSTGLCMIAGEVTTDCYVDVAEVARQTIREIGYTSPTMGYDCHTCAVLTSIHAQSPDISRGVTTGLGLHKEQGAGDQGIMFGYATNETAEFMPLPIELAHRLVEKQAELRETHKLPWLRPDCKSQVTVEYRNRKPVRVHTVVLSTQHAASVSHATIRKEIIAKLIRKTISKKFLDSKTIYHVNPTGRFVLGGPGADTGLTGRKIIVDTYGGSGRHGGGAFSGKDPSKVDRSAAYAARHCAKNVVAAGLANECELELAYAIGVADPLAVYVNTRGSGKLADSRIERIVKRLFDFTPSGMIERLHLLRPIYKETARFGHFGRSLPEFTWERLDMVDALRTAAGI